MDFDISMLESVVLINIHSFINILSTTRAGQNSNITSAAANVTDNDADT